MTIHKKITNLPNLFSEAENIKNMLHFMQNMIMHNDILLAQTWQLIQALKKTSSPKMEGVFATASPAIDVFYQTCGQQHRPTLYTPGFVFLFSGEKSAQLGQTRHVYNPQQGLLLTGVYPVYCDAKASEQEPLAGVQIRLDRLQMAQLLHQLASHQSASSNTEKSPAAEPSGFLGVRHTPEIAAALFALLNSLADPIATSLFSPTQIQSVVYAALQQPQVQAYIHAWATQDGRYAHFLAATDYIVRALAQPITLDEIGKQAGMSVPTVYRVFKHYTGESPMQYVKKLRLCQAHVQLSQTGCTVQAAAYDAGYESVSQFSREYKRYFGQSPKHVRDVRVRGG